MALVAALLTSCAIVPGPVPPPVGRPSPTAAVSPTRTVAFPTLIPTSTWTPEPTLAATPDLGPGLGPLTLEDSMEDASAWDLPITAAGAAAMTDGRLTLSVRQPRAYHSARRFEPVAGDFFAEIEAYTELCSPGDEIGLIARAGGLGEQYRFLIGCDGTARITRVLEEGSRALTLRLAFPAIHSGAPATNRLGIWLHGLDLKFSVNGDEVLTVRDAALQRGSLGVIAHAGSGGQVSAAFDDLRFYTLADAPASSSPTVVPASGSPQP